MTQITNLIQQLSEINKEIGEGPPHETWKGFLNIELQDDEDNEYEIVEVKPDTIDYACGCWVGATIIIKKKEKK